MQTRGSSADVRQEGAGARVERRCQAGTRRRRREGRAPSSRSRSPPRRHLPDRRSCPGNPGPGQAGEGWPTWWGDAILAWAAAIAIPQRGPLILGASLPVPGIGALEPGGRVREPQACSPRWPRQRRPQVASQPPLVSPGPGSPSVPPLGCLIACLDPSQPERVSPTQARHGRSPETRFFKTRGQVCEI